MSTVVIAYLGLFLLVVVGAVIANHLIGRPDRGNDEEQAAWLQKPDP